MKCERCGHENPIPGEDGLGHGSAAGRALGARVRKRHRPTSEQARKAVAARWAKHRARSSPVPIVGTMAEEDEP